MPPLRFLRFRADLADTIWSGDRRAFLLATPDGPPALVDSICPHRGGPLGQGIYDCRTKTLRCPWHGRQHPRRLLLSRAWPALRIGSEWVVALPPDADGAALSFQRGTLRITLNAWEET